MSIFLQHRGKKKTAPRFKHDARLKTDVEKEKTQKKLRFHRVFFYRLNIPTNHHLHVCLFWVLNERLWVKRSAQCSQHTVRYPELIPGTFCRRRPPANELPPPAKQSEFLPRLSCFSTCRSLTLLWPQPIPPPPSSAVLWSRSHAPLLGCLIVFLPSVDNFQTLRKKNLRERTAPRGRGLSPCGVHGHLVI